MEAVYTSYETEKELAVDAVRGEVQDLVKGLEEKIAKMQDLLSEHELCPAKMAQLSQQIHDLHAGMLHLVLREFE